MLRHSSGHSGWNLTTETPMGKLSTHVLDTALGAPAKGVRIDLYRVGQDGRELIGQATTNQDGRCDASLLAADALQKGVYELVFHAGDSLDRKSVVSGKSVSVRVVVGGRRIIKKKK